MKFIYSMYETLRPRIQCNVNNLSHFLMNNILFINYIIIAYKVKRKKTTYLNIAIN